MDDFETTKRKRTKERWRKSRVGLKREREHQPQEGKASPRVGKGRRGGQKSPGPEPCSPSPHALPSDLHRPGRGRGTRMRSGALRQPPQLPEVAWTGWSRLEPVAPARELKTHKGRRRLTARVSLRGAAVGGCWAVPLPQPLSGAGASLRP